MSNYSYTYDFFTKLHNICRCCRHATKIINHQAIRKLNNFKTDSPLTIVAKLFFTSKNLYFVNYEVRAGCPKLGHITLISCHPSPLAPPLPFVFAPRFYCWNRGSIPLIWIELGINTKYANISEKSAKTEVQ